MKWWLLHFRPNRADEAERVFAGWLQAKEMERQHADALKAAQAARFVVRTLKILDHCYGCFCETVIDMACDYMAVYVFFFYVYYCCYCFSSMAFFSMSGQHGSH